MTSIRHAIKLFSIIWKKLRQIEFPSGVIVCLTLQKFCTAVVIHYDLPVYTSTPIVKKVETQQDRINMQPAFEIIKRLDRMESDLTMFKQSVISNIDQQIQDLKSSVFDMIAKMKPDQTYAAAVQTSSQSSDGLIFQQGVRNRSQSCE